MNKEEGLDQEKMLHWAQVLTKEITLTITSKRPAEQEVLCGATAALANVMVIMVTKMVGKERAPDTISYALAGAFKQVNQLIAEIENEKHTDTETPGG
jgi:hypothetical protein